MSGTLGALSRLASTPPGTATVETVVAACAEIRRLFDADDAYVVRSGDPAFVRLGDDGDPAQYEIKQRGYWYAWREAAANPGEPNRLLTVTDRLVGDVVPLSAQVPATHIAAILPGDESNSEMLIVRGPWPDGLSEDQVELLGSVRPLMAYLIGNVLDSERRERLQGQMRVLGEIAEAFTQAEHADNPLSALATALSRASGFAWVVILVFDPGIERVIDRAINVGRHSNTETAERGKRGQESENSGERDLLGARHMAWTRQPYTVPDVGDPNEQLLVNDELRHFYEQAHILSMASFPVFTKDALYATITFCGSEQHAFDETEMGFLGSLVAQAGPTMRAFKLNRELRETDQRLRAVFTNAPVFITVFEPDGTIVLLEGADKGTIAQETASLVGSRIYDLVPGYFAEELRANLERGLAGDSFTADMQWDGRDFQTRFAPLRDHDGSATGVIGVTTDESERLRATRELQRMNIDLTAAMERAEASAREAEASRLRAEYLAQHDALTGVLSRRAWFEMAASRHPSAIAVFDVDRFKRVNDQYGHPAGDTVLKTVAESLGAAIGEDGVIGRLGGEEFGALFNVSVADAERACQRAVELVAARPCGLSEGRVVSVTISAGLAPCRRASDNTKDAVARAYDIADKALYEAKNTGRDRLVTAHAAA